MDEGDKTMKVSISFKHLEHTPSLDSRIQEKSQRLKKYFDGELEAKWTCSADQGQHHTELSIHGPHFHMQASGESDNLYKSLDIVVDKIERQLSKQKDKWKEKMHHQEGHKDLKFYDGKEDAWLQHEQDHFDDVKKS